MNFGTCTLGLGGGEHFCAPRRLRFVFVKSRVRMIGIWCRSGAAQLVVEHYLENHFPECVLISLGTCRELEGSGFSSLALYAC
jgi:hypothetical protein